MRENIPPYRHIALSNTAWWLEVCQRGEKTKYAEFAELTAIGFFYLGNLEHGRETSYLYSISREQKIQAWAGSRYRLLISLGASEADAEAAERRNDDVLWLFQAGLYRSLANRPEEAALLWQKLVERRRSCWPRKDILRRSEAYLWLYEAYALAKLGRYREVRKPADLGFKWIGRGKGLYKEPPYDPKVYGLAAVLKALAAYKLQPSGEGKAEAQRTLVAYKGETYPHNRAAYDVIFDLQFSYPDVFTPVLPGWEPGVDDVPES
jgi:hypothetical protein